jgi:hypothetical protein
MITNKLFMLVGILSVIYLVFVVLAFKLKKKKVSRNALIDNVREGQNNFNELPFIISIITFFVIGFNYIGDQFIYGNDEFVITIIIISIIYLKLKK